MALSDYFLNYTKDWKNPADFPTYETKEAKVREDMQLLFDEMRNAFNNFLVDLSAGLIPFSSSTEVPEDNIQAAILNVQSQVSSAATGSIPQRSLDADRLKENTLTNAELGDACVNSRTLAVVDADGENGAVTANNISKSAVTRPKIADEAVDGTKLAPGSVDSGHIKLDAVTGPKIKDGAVNNAKLTVVDENEVNGAVGANNINKGAVTASKIAQNAVSTMYNAQLTVAGWIGSAAPFTQSVTVTGVLATDEPMVDLIPSDVYATAALEDSQWGQIYKAVATADTITFYAKVKPSVALNFKARCIRK